MGLLLEDSIAAPASAPGGGLRGIIRLSGPGLHEVLQRLFPGQVPESRRPVRFAGQAAPQGWTVPIPIDVHYWPTRRSFTGEPLAELHLIGATPLIETLLAEVYRCGCRAAQAGEFTQRAFLNGRIDLLQAEAVLGVIDASSQGQLEAALGQLAGGISTIMKQLREQLLLHLADLEAGLDFVEEDIDFVDRGELQRRLDEVLVWLRALSQQADQRMLAARPQVVLAGLPNAGKSTLFNSLIQSSDALVSDVAGTTRDYLQRTVCWSGMNFDLIDTAGWEEALTESLGAAADSQRKARYERADLIVWCEAATLDAAEQQVNDQLRTSCESLGVNLLTATTKSDLCPGPDRESATLHLSVHEGRGLEELQQHVVQHLRELRESRSELLHSSAARCRHALAGAIQSAERAQQLAIDQAGDELIAVELREVLDCLGEIVGEVYTDDILDRIFSRFCIGK